MGVIRLKAKRARPMPTPVSEARFRTRVVRMGVVAPSATTAAAMEGLLHRGICTKATQQWLSRNPAGGASRDQLLAEIYERLEECPSPDTEWQSVREVLDDDLLAGLLAIRQVSLRRYAKGERSCPDLTAVRLHWLALVIEQLEGTYSAYGIRRWFQRPRAALDGQASLDRLQGPWDPDDNAIQPIFSLAQSASFGMVAS
jgi:hypothetical protein